MNWLGMKLPTPKLKDAPGLLITVGSPPFSGGVLVRSGGAQPYGFAVMRAFGSVFVVTLTMSTPDLLNEKTRVLSGEPLRKMGIDGSETSSELPPLIPPSSAGLLSHVLNTDILEAEPPPR